MKIERVSVLLNGSCNFCNRGEILAIEGSVTVSYPYKYVTVVKTDSSGVSVNFCDSCLQELVNHISEEEE